MLRQLFVFVLALVAVNATANTNPEVDTLDEFLALEIEKLELEQELFGTPTNGEDIISIASIRTGQNNARGARRAYGQSEQD